MEGASGEIAWFCRARCAELIGENRSSLAVMEKKLLMFYSHSQIGEILTFPSNLHQLMELTPDLSLIQI